MKKNKKVLIFSLLAIFSFCFLTPNVFAASKYYLSVGTDYGSIGGNSTPEANWVGSTLTLNGYTGSTVVAPTYTSFNSKVLGRYTLESDVLYFLGHASSDNVSWNYQAKNGNYAVGIVNKNSDATYYGNGVQYRMTGIGRYNLSNVDLAVFQGCSTAANSSSNLPKYANSQGAKVAIGWASDISQSDSLPWIKRFFSNGFFPNNVTNMVNYANSFGYVTSAIKNTRIYGNGNTSVFPASATQVMSVTNVDNRKNTINEPYNTNSSSLQEIKSKIVSLIKENIDEEINENDFIIETAQNDSGKIYDLYFTINGVKTSLGYTVFTNADGTIITDIYNNMNNYEPEVLKTEKSLTIENKLNQVTTAKANEINKTAVNVVKSENLNTTTEIVDTFNYYDVSEAKLYQITLVKVELPTGAYSLIDYKTEL